MSSYFVLHLSAGDIVVKHELFDGAQDRNFTIRCSFAPRLLTGVVTVHKESGSKADLDLQSDHITRLIGRSATLLFARDLHRVKEADHRGVTFWNRHF